MNEFQQYASGGSGIAGGLGEQLAPQGYFGALLGNPLGG